MALVVSTPPMEGPEVHEAQELLKRDNVFEQDFLEGTVDRVWGPECGRAVIRGKTAIGYPRDTIGPGFGTRFEDYLTGARKTSPEMKERATMRRKEAREELREQAVRLAKAELDTNERPAGSNDVKYARWYMGVEGDPGWTAARPGPPWCLIFQAWIWDRVFEAAGVSGWVKRGVRSAFCPTLVGWSVRGDFGLDQVRAQNVQPGDLVCYQFDADSNADHVGMVTDPPGKGQNFRAIEGNTSSQSDANGGNVEHRARTLSTVYRPSTGGLAFIRVSPID